MLWKEKNYLQQEGIKIIDHPPYSPDSAPCDFWLFDYIKKNLGDQVNAQTIKRQISKIM